MRLLLLLVVLGCKSDPQTAPASKEPHWSTRPLETSEATTRRTRYSITLPKGMTVRDRNRSGMRYELPGLALTISTGGIERSMAEFRATHRDDTVWLRTDTLPDGFLATYQDPSRDDPHRLMVHLYRGFGVNTDHANEGMTCHGELRPAHPGEVVKTSIPAAEKICLSLQMLEQP